MRERWTAELERRGPAGAARACSRSAAPWAAAEIEPTDRQRIVRALELLDAGELEPPDGAVRAVDRRRSAVPTLLVGLVMEREQLYARIDARVDQMLAAGAQAEVRRANAAGASITARKALGFEELLAGDVEAMKRRTRNYARRQLTWMRKLASVHVLDVTGRSRRRRGRSPEESAAAAVAHGSGVNGYMSTTAATTANAHSAISSRATRRCERPGRRRRCRSPASRSPCSRGSSSAVQIRLSSSNGTNVPRNQASADRVGSWCPARAAARPRRAAAISQRRSTNAGSASSMIGGLIMPEEVRRRMDADTDPGAGRAGLMFRYSDRLESTSHCHG